MRNCYRYREANASLDSISVSYTQRLDRVVMIRRQIALELGTVVPIIRLRDNIQLNPNQYIIKIKGIQVTEGEILFDHYMACLLYTSGKMLWIYIQDWNVLKQIRSLPRLFLRVK